MSSFENLPGTMSGSPEPGNKPAAAITLIAIANAFLLLFVIPRIYSRLEKGLFSWDEGEFVQSVGYETLLFTMSSYLCPRDGNITIYVSIIIRLTHIVTGRFDSFFCRDN